MTKYIDEIIPEVLDLEPGTEIPIEMKEGNDE